MNLKKELGNFDKTQTTKEQKFDLSSNTKDNEKANSNSTNSPFITNGKFLNNVIENELYNYNNYEYVFKGKHKHVLGSGAFGQVYLAKNKVNGQFYAIKHMDKKNLISKGAKLDIVSREINIHRRLEHDNIVKLYSSFEDKNSFYLIMEYANNQNLFNVIKKNNGMSEKEAFKYFIQAVSAVNFLHEQKLIHRDLKPENILIDKNDVVKLCDFGWCVELKYGNRSTFCGTYEYMAPEIVTESPYNNSIDIWSLGILLYELIHGYSPFRAKINTKNERDEFSEISKNIINNKFTFDKNISNECKNLIKDLLSPITDTRIKVTDIFFHPWVIRFDNDKFTQQNTSENDCVKRNITLFNKEISKNAENKVNENPDVIKSDNLKIYKNLKKYMSQEIQNEKNLSIQVQDKTNFSLNQTRNSKDSLFDKVLNQVQEKNNNNKYNFAFKMKSKMDENSNIIDKSNNIFSIERQISRIEILNKEETISKIHMSDLSYNTENQSHLFSGLENKNNELEISSDFIFNSPKNLNIQINKPFEIPKNIQIVKSQNSGKKENSIVKNDDSNKEIKVNLIKSEIRKNDQKNNVDNLFPKIDNKINLNHIKTSSFENSNQTIESNNNIKKKTTSFENNNDIIMTSYFIKKENQIKSNNTKKQGFFDKKIKKHNNNLESNVDRPKHMDKELDLGFLPKELLYNEKTTYCESTINLIAAIEILEKAQHTKNNSNVKKDLPENKSFWSMINLFKCGGYN